MKFKVVQKPRLNRYGIKLSEGFQSLYGEIDCSCHINPPCNSCLHPGNPKNLEENPDVWEDSLTVPQIVKE